MHINGIPYHCHLDNLKYGTQAENVRQAIDDGYHNRSPLYEPKDWKQVREKAKEYLRGLHEKDRAARRADSREPLGGRG